MKITISTIAKKANVSPSLVSQVLNRKDIRVSEETKKRIFKIAKDNHYCPSKLASAMRSGKTGVIALIIPFTPQGFFSNLVYYAEKYAHQKGYTIVIINNFEDIEKESNALKMYNSGLFEGFAIAALSQKDNSNIYQEMKDANFPFIFVDRSNTEGDAPSVRSDHYNISVNLTKKAILEDGIKDLTYLYRKDRISNETSELRLQGYIDTMKQYNLSPNIEYFTYRDSNLDDFVDSIRTIKNSKGYFIYSGYYIPLIHKAFNILEWDISKKTFYSVDSCLFSYSDISDPKNRNIPKAILVNQDTRKIAEKMIDLLIDRINRKKVEKLNLIDILN